MRGGKSNILHNQTLRLCRNTENMPQVENAVPNFPNAKEEKLKTLKEN